MMLTEQNSVETLPPSLTRFSKVSLGPKTLVQGFIFHIDAMSLISYDLMIFFFILDGQFIRRSPG